MFGRSTLATTLWVGILLAASAGWTTDTPPSNHWSVATPSGHEISHSDRYKETYGICLRQPDRESALFYEPMVYVSHLLRWQAYPGYVVGQAQKGYFLFKAEDSSVVYYNQHAALDAAVQELGFMIPPESWVTPIQAELSQWALLYQARHDRILETWAARYVQNLTQGERQALKAELGATGQDQDWLHEMLASAVTLTYEHAFHGRHAQSLIAVPSSPTVLTELDGQIESLAAQVDPQTGTPAHFLSYISEQSTQIADDDLLYPRHDSKALNCPVHTATRLPGHLEKTVCLALLQEHLTPTEPESDTRSSLALDPESRAQVRSRHLPPHKLVSPIAQLRAQLELAKSQHGTYPDLVKDGWSTMTQNTFPDPEYRPAPPDAEGSVGPYLQEPPANPLARHAQEDPTSIATDTSAAWQYNPETGSIKAVVTLTAERFEQQGLTAQACVRIDPPPR